ncbi:MULTISPECIES: hypothetical protein [unclassified Moorena]|uniref:hypothetical protein n=1 Tax=unclassified Moorena TaxID=2683338 RepID=UPI0013BF64AD|nr:MULTISPECIES: hypothetical protein [unclassified Moorena]NEP33612.1 hypothetical protein [Moorena sp. SIO3B2]NEQ18449.1 hypothetical protein [Moorena sp. SIO3E2]NES44798.1 hypothetical protein [Moorena sp. SIO2C4]
MANDFVSIQHSAVSRQLKVQVTQHYSNAYLFFSKAVRLACVAQASTLRFSSLADTRHADS